jgi:hypothetical protein
VKRTLPIALIGAALVAAGCSNPFKNFSEQPVKADAALVKQIGLPLYPGAKPLPAAGMHMHMEIKGQAVDGLTYVAVANAPIAQVDAWYESRMPASEKSVNFHLFSTTVIQWQQVSRDGTMHQVQLTGMNNQTQISLMRSVVAAAASPTPSP